MAATKNKYKRPLTRHNHSIRNQLTLATCSLLTAQHADAQSYDNDWVGDVSYATYQEGDDRISVNKLIASVNGNVSDANRIKLLVVVDSMTGTTPTGGLASLGSDSAVSVTGTSGGGFSTGGSPLAVAPFDDTRLAFKFDWEHDFSRTLRMGYGTSVSVENDYNSFGASINLAKDDANKINTFTTGIAFSSDRISQLSGDTPGPGSQTQDQIFFDEGERTTIDFIVGYSRVLSAKAVYQVNLGYTGSDGYHSDPYKVVSIANQDNIEASRIYESRPRSRRRNFLYNKFVYQFSGGNNLHIAYRYYGDDWEVDSHTIDTKYRFNFNSGQYFEPHLRLYSQSAADFYVRTLPIGAEIPMHISADNRLSETTSGTLGLKYAFPFGDKGELRLRLEYIKWKHDNAIIETTEAALFQISYKQTFE